MPNGHDHTGGARIPWAILGMRLQWLSFHNSPYVISHSCRRPRGSKFRKFPIHKNSGEGLLSDMSSIPPELCTPTPRRVRWRALPLLLVAFWLALVLGFPSAIIQSSWREFHIDDILAARGEIAKGHVLGKIERPPTAKNPGVRYKHRIDYEFVPPGALEPVRGSDWVNPAEYHRLDSDGPVDVVFDPADPSKSEVEYTERTAFRSSRLQFERARIVAPLFAALGCAMAFAIAYAPFRQRQLLRWGVPARARIVTAEKRRMGGRGGGALLTYRFVGAQGVEIQGRSYQPRKFLDGPTSADPAVAALWREPTAVFDAENSSRNMLYSPNPLLRVKS